jgi:hypothetical protein
MAPRPLHGEGLGSGDGQGSGEAPAPDAGEPAPRRWSRLEAYAALDEAVRRGLRPGAAWLAGLLYPLFAFSFEVAFGELKVIHELGRFQVLSGATLELRGGVLSVAPVGLLLALAWLRVQAQAAAGLLITLDRRGPGAIPTFGAVRARDLWAAGRPLAMDCFLVLLARFGLGVLATALLLAVPAMLLLAAGQWLDDLEPLALAAAMAVGAVGFLYLAVLEVAAQLALVSCVSNRRGAVSALQHAWKLMANDPRATLRAALGHFALLFAVSAALAGAGWMLGGGLLLPLSVIVSAGAGVAHASYWNRAFDGLGGWRTHRAVQPEPVASAGTGPKAAAAV